MNNRALFYYTIAVALTTCAFVSAFFLFRFPPYYPLRNFVVELLAHVDQSNADPASRFDTFDLSPLLHIQSQDDVERVRRQLINYVWGVDRLPVQQMPSVEQNVVPPFPVEQLDGLYARIDRLSYASEFGIDSQAFHFLAKQPRGETLIFHQGHGARFQLNMSAFAHFLSEGLDVVVLSMPLTGFNARPQYQHPRLGPMVLTTHEHLRQVTPARGSSIQFFLNGLLSVVNYLSTRNQQTRDMQTHLWLSGISGGGWTSTLYAAIDPRIVGAYPVAGSYPMFARLDGSKKIWGDYEQLEPGLYNIANYFDLYLMSSAESYRTQRQLYNLHDPCCFSGNYYSLYAPLVTARLESIDGGRFSVFIDTENREHSVSQASLNAISADMREHRDSLTQYPTEETSQARPALPRVTKAQDGL